MKLEKICNVVFRLKVDKKGAINICKHGTHTYVNIINKGQNRSSVPVDACIAEEIRELNDAGIITLGCCCGHGRAGQLIEWENGFGKWKGYYDPPHALIRAESVVLAKEMGYQPYPYYYADGVHNDVWQMHLKTGCITEEDVKEWHKTDKGVYNIESRNNY
ncbi:hypothetical protein CIL05_07360 [Virgibacillus profundi]|uniref:Uncharacterized protein n=1 Tax=Virgibacillus profundi TaxID=2024555 RepID=A0A2A2IFY1_9BACI|nr:hypothetical protein [Virgibacillus profundi]PAV30278.1 hypothetical protein CIL05_07360 [Virgibacillus profundi]PXY54450.1 hypothetical protein CIT14_07445 [Virgibacillus profundi]